MKGADLLMKMKVGLLEALTGFTETIKLLDRTNLAITSIPGYKYLNGLLLSKGYYLTPGNIYFNASIYSYFNQLFTGN